MYSPFFGFRYGIWTRTDENIHLQDVLNIRALAVEHGTKWWEIKLLFPDRQKPVVLLLGVYRKLYQSDEGGGEVKNTYILSPKGIYIGYKMDLVGNQWPFLKVWPFTVSLVFEVVRKLFRSFNNRLHYHQLWLILWYY